MTNDPEAGVEIIKRVWCVYADEDTSASFAAFLNVKRCDTLGEAEDYVRQHQRIGRYSRRPLLHIQGPWRDTGAGHSRIDGETRAYYPQALSAE